MVLSLFLFEFILEILEKKFHRKVSVIYGRHFNVEVTLLSDILSCFLGFCFKTWKFYSSCSS